MYCVIHGGTDPILRQMSTEYLTSLPFQGVAIGGSFGRTLEDMYSMLDSLIGHLPPDLPRHLLGIADEKTPERVVKYGIDTFDSAYPTRAGRHGRLFTRYFHVSFLVFNYHIISRFCSYVALESKLTLPSLNLAENSIRQYRIIAIAIRTFVLF